MIYLSEHEPERAEDINRLSEQAVDLVVKGANPRGAPGQWFELGADRQSAHGTATSLYGLGIKTVPEWAQLWIKGLGAASLAGLSEQVDGIRNGLSVDKTVDLLSKSTGAYQRQRKQPVRHVTLRWEEGMRLFDKFWASDPRVRSALERLRRGHR